MKRLFLFLLIVLTVLPIGAQIRGNSIVVTVEPDRQDWNYQVGETAKFTVEVQRSGNSRLVGSSEVLRASSIA